MERGGERLTIYMRTEMRHSEEEKYGVEEIGKRNRGKSDGKKKKLGKGDGAGVRTKIMYSKGLRKRGREGDLNGESRTRMERRKEKKCKKSWKKNRIKQKKM